MKRKCLYEFTDNMQMLHTRINTHTYTPTRMLGKTYTAVNACVIQTVPDKTALFFFEQLLARPHDKIPP